MTSVAGRPADTAKRSRSRAKGDRRIACGRTGACRLCPLLNRPYRQGLLSKHRKALSLLEESVALGEATVCDPVTSPRPLGYRSHCKLAVRAASHGPRGKRGSPKPVERFSVGLFRPGTHEVADAVGCPLHTHPVAALLRALKEELEGSSLSPYDEVRHAGDVRYVAVRAARSTGEVLVTFVVRAPVAAPLKEIVRNLRGRGIPVRSAHMNVNAAEGNAIFGPATQRLAGRQRVREGLLGLSLELGATAFYQANPWQAENLYGRVEALAGPVPPGGHAWDLYGGIGPISLLLARAGWRVTSIEEGADATRDARRNARTNGLESSVEYVNGRVEDVLEGVRARAGPPALVVANPTRRGMAPAVAAALGLLLADLPEARLLYVSCEVRTLARDLGILTAGQRSVRRVESFDMLPQTDKLEWLVLV